MKQDYIKQRLVMGVIIVVILIVISLFTGCLPAYKTIPLKGKYSQGPYIAESDKSINEVWQNIVDFFGQKGIGIKIIDRSSGLIISDTYRMPWTHEDDKGRLINKSAYLVIPRTMTKSFNGSPSGTISPQYITAEWNIIVKEKEGKTLININIVNLRYTDFIKTNEPFVSYDSCLSTGVFENYIASLIK